ncbi:MAG: ABC-F family ATP-binding cassette domain-containing protein [Dehalococcoidia bacterium]
MLARGSPVLRVSDLSVAAGGRVLFSGLSFVVNAGERLAVIGPNGAGKTTLLRVIAGELSPAAGTVALSPGAAIAMLPQGLDEAEATAATMFPHAFALIEPERRLEAVAAELATATSNRADHLASEYDRLLAVLSGEISPTAGFQALMPTALTGDEPVDSLSGGERQRLALAEILASAPDVLLLDEPTNHLDLDMVAWVETWLRGFPGPVVVVSHDRAFLDAVATHVLPLDPAAGGPPELFTGTYSGYASELQRRRGRQWEAYRRQRREERQLKREISAIESRARNIESRTIHFHFRKRAAKVARQAVTLKSRLERELDSANRAERPKDDPVGIEGQFDQAPTSASTLVSATGLTLRAGETTLLRDAAFTVGRGERVALVGPNGSGKTTLLRAVLGYVTPQSGALHVAGSAIIGALAQDDESMFADAASLTPVQWLRQRLPLTARDAANELHRFLGDHRVLETAIGALSYGERRRLALAQLILGGANLLLLDEPTNHLDLPAREAFESAFDAYRGAAIVATHDRYFIERFATRILAIQSGTVVAVDIPATSV